VNNNDIGSKVIINQDRTLSEFINLKCL